MDWLRSMAKFFIALAFHPVMVLLVVMTPIGIIIEIDAFRNALDTGLPVSSAAPFMLWALFGLCFYIAMKVEFLGRPYRKMPWLFPALQMMVYLAAMLKTCIVILNGWADRGLYPKETAIALMILAAVGMRLFVSWLFWRHPLVPANPR